MQYLLIAKAVLQIIGWVGGLVGVGALGVQFFTTRKSDLQGAAANPTPAQQTVGAIGDIAGGAGGLATGAGGLARGIGESPMVFLIGGLALLILIGGRR